MIVHSATPRFVLIDICQTILDTLPSIWFEIEIELKKKKKYGISRISQFTTQERHLEILKTSLQFERMSKSCQSEKLSVFKIKRKHISMIYIVYISKFFGGCCGDAHNPNHSSH